MIWLAVGAVLLVAAAWALVLALEWPIWVAVLVTLTVLAIAGILVLFKFVRARRRGAALERELMRQATKQANQARPERRQEILALQQQMSEAIRSLQRSKLGRSGGKAALYALPWYVMIGPPAAGKTTALERSGLAFTSAGGRRRKVQGVAGTRNCDWWFSEEAILLDTAGRFATEDDDQAEWLAFLQLLKRHRPKRPLDGVIVAISASDLLGSNAEQLDETAKKLRARLDELVKGLELVLPVYVVVTKADLIAGFVEFWGDLSAAGRAQPWGATFDPQSDALTDPAAAVKAEFDVLTAALHARALERLGGERAPEPRARVLSFPLEFAAVRRPLARFVEELFRPSQYQESPLLRGFYFTSGTQTGTPVDRVVAAGAGAARPPGLQRTQFEERPSGAASYFVTDLLRRIVFPDRQLGTSSSRGLRRHFKRQVVLGAAALLLTAIIVIPAAASYVDNLGLIEGTRRDVGLARAAATQALRTSAALEGLDRLLERYRLLDKASHEWSVQPWWGPYTAPPQRDAVRSLYLERLRQMIEGPVRAQLLASLGSVSDVQNLEPGAFKAGHDWLRLYLMLSHPDRLDVETAAAELARVWARASQRGVLASGPTVPSHAQNYVGAVVSDATLAWEEDGVLVARVREALSKMPIDALAYARLEESAAGAPPVRPDQIFLGASARFVTYSSKLEVPGLYTALGWEKVRPLLEDESKADFDPWVLGRSAGGSDQWSMSQLRATYFENYIRAWRDFLLGLDVQTPSTLRVAIEELSALGKIDGPYVRLFRRIAENVRLNVGPRTLLEKVAEKAEEKADDAIDKAKGEPAKEPERKISPVERDFARLLHFGFGDTPPDTDAPMGDVPPSGLTQYLDQLRTLEVSLVQIERDAIEPSAQFRAELARAADVVEKLLTRLGPAEHAAIEPLLMNPIRGSQSAVESAEGAQLNERWRVEVWEPYQRMIKRYPFAPSQYEVPLADFAEFFRPNSGIIWRFYDENLASRLLSSGTRFSPRPSEQKAGFRGDFLSCLGSAKTITDAIFFGDTAQPNLTLGVKMQAVGPEVSEITLRVDGQAIVYRNEPERWQSLQWPGKDGPAGASVQVRGAKFKDEIKHYGEFALFRLLTEGRVKPLAPGAVDLEAAWPLNQGDTRVLIQFRPPTARHPFSRGFFKALRCPASMMAGGAAPAGD